jgi:general secretion pathway protein M
MALTITKREKYAIALAAAVLIGFVLIQMIIMPFVEKSRRLERQLDHQARTLQEMQRLKADYEMLRLRAEQASQDLTRRRRGFTLFSFLDELAGRAGLKDRIAYMKPSTMVQENSPYKLSIVETKLQSVTMKQLTAYLYSIETSMNRVRVTKLSITRTGQQTGFVDAVLLVETFETS